MTVPLDRTECEPITKAGRAWHCKAGREGCTYEKPCASCRGRRNRRKGMTKQAFARRELERASGVPAARWRGHLSNEESWAGLPVRVEAKEGAQTRPAATRFLKDEAQSQAARPIGDLRPFVNVLMAEGMGKDGIVQLRLSQFKAVCEAMCGVA